MARLESRYVCQACAASSIRWEGQCRACGAWNTLVETVVESARGARSRGGAPRAGEADVRPVPLRAITDVATTRSRVGLDEVDRVLGGGLVPGSLVLLGGEPGIGKSTLVLEVAAGIAGGEPRSRDGWAAGVLYASGEESASQLHLRAGRLGLVDGVAGARIHVVAETRVELISALAERLRPGLLVIDSIQTLTSDALEGPAGSVGQVREATARLQALAKTADVPVILVGHVTKDGTLAGPKTLEHLVDVVLTLEGERFGPLRLLRATKNRFGSTEEIGVLEMTGEGLREVMDPTRAFLGGPATLGAAGVAIAAGLEGSRPLLIELQALVARAPYGMPRRTVAGLDANRVALLVAVLGRRAGVALGDHDIYASVAGGLQVNEPAVDLPLALALASSARDRAVRPGTVACGELGLLGELRPVRALERRLREAERLGFRSAIVPLDPPGRPAAEGSRPGVPERIGDLRVTRVSTLREALEAALVPGAGSGRDGDPAGEPVLGSPVP